MDVRTAAAAAFGRTMDLPNNGDYWPHSPSSGKKTNDNITLMGNFPSDQRTYTTSQNHDQRRTETKSSRNNKNNLQPNKHFLFVLTGSICRVVLSHTGISERELTQPISLGLNVVIGSHNR